MKKVALFVEGQSECIFAREVLLKWYEYDASRVAIESFSLKGNELTKVQRGFGSRDSDLFYQIINVGNDERVLGYLIDHAQRMCDQGFTLIMGLRDMYSEKYRKVCKDRLIHNDVNRRFIEAVEKVVSSYPCAANISMHFAIMEVESWLLALLYPDDPINPEITFFCPADELAARLVKEGRRYKKSESDLESICSRFNKQDIESLISSDKCRSFASFVEVLLSK